ncbi:Protein NUCLEAR FUSION DEFECTIVE 4 [Zea mays]|uniref:Protein NUCLEAR FUSION DEFECTIVE 4 n=2 Tax=Zea mays TaxID=4577 RepID=A0A3L6FDI4_MAIZE|nr:Major facilitator superfamily protein [Zea mays]PWZ30371.1 Protein NUCLEAR FUSION DEFECTIVE 4 [Zea mays]
MARGEVSMCTPGFALRVVQSRWFVVYASIIVMAASGSTYIFALYSKVLRSKLGYNQETLNKLSFFKDLGTNVGIISGLVQQVAPTWLVLLIGAGMNLAGYLMIYLALTRDARRRRPGAIYTQLYLAIYGDDAASLVLLVAWLPAAFNIFTVYTIRVLPYARRRDGGKPYNTPFYHFLYLSLALASYLLVMIVVEKQVQFSHAAYVVTSTALLIVLFSPVGVVVKEEYKAVSQLEESLQQPPAIAVEEPKAGTAGKGDDESSSPPLCGGGGMACLTNMFKPPALGEDYSIMQALVSVEMLVLFVISVFGIGGTLTAIDNMAQIGQSLGYPAKSINTFVSLISIWNYAGRAGAGYISEFLLARYRLPRPLVLTAVLLVSCIGHLFIAFGVPQSLYAASVIIGFCFGAQWPLLFAIISEVFGLKYYSSLFNFGSAASPAGAYVLNVIITGRMYDAEATRQHGGVAAVGDKICKGVVCFKRPFIIITGVTFAGALVSLVLVWRTRNFYRGDIYAKFKVTPAAASESESLDGKNVEMAEETEGKRKKQVVNDDLY